MKSTNCIGKTIFGDAEKPLFEKRGLMLDISRNRVPTMDCLRELIDALALLRFNELQLYTEHTFAYSQHEEVWRDASPMTASEIREVDAYCKERGIELVPNQNSFGHMERWLKHEAYRDLAECPDGFDHPIGGRRDVGSTLYPSQDSLNFIDELYGELLPNFSSPNINIGCDEPWELGMGRSREKVEELGKHTVYLDFLNQLFELARKHGVVPQFWADIILERPDLVPELPKDVVPVIWGYDADHPFREQCRIVAEAGFENRYYVAPGVNNWISFLGRLDQARPNLVLAAAEGHRNKAKGLLMTAWGDRGYHQPWPTLYPSLILTAQATWGVPLAEDELPDLVDQVFKMEPGNGKALCELGLIDLMLPQPPHGGHTSFLHTAFFADEDAFKKHLELTDRETLERTLLALDRVSTECIDDSIRLGADMSRYALERCLSLPHKGTIEDFKKRFEHEWLRQHRPGGLQESLNLFPDATADG